MIIVIIIMLTNCLYKERFLKLIKIIEQFLINKIKTLYFFNLLAVEN